MVDTITGAKFRWQQSLKPIMLYARAATLLNQQKG
jgi:hypothetical protein